MQEYTSLYSNIYSKWRRIIEITYLIGWVVFTLSELILGIVSQMQLGRPFTLSYASKFVIFPSVTSLVVILFTCGVYHSKKASDNVKNYATLFMITAIAFILALVHSYFFITYALFVMPVVISAAFSSPKMTLVTAGVSLVLLWINACLCNVFDNVYSKEEHLMNARQAALLLVFATAAVYLIVSIHQDRERAIASYQEDNSRLTREVAEDGLTGLYNHTTFYRDLEQQLKDSREDGHIFCLAMIDVDNFKQVNDSYGHDAGDIVLMRISHILGSELGKYGKVYRYGGDEFSAILTCEGDQAEQALMAALQEVPRIREEKLAGHLVTLSIGLHPVTDFTESAENVFYTTDQILYKAKMGGKNQIAEG